MAGSPSYAPIANDAAANEDVCFYRRTQRATSANSTASTAPPPTRNAVSGTGLPTFPVRYAGEEEPVSLVQPP